MEEAASRRARRASGWSTSARGSFLSRKVGALPRLLTPFKLGLGGRVGSGRQWWSWVSLDELVEAYRFALERDDLSGRFNLTSPNPVTNVQFTKALGKALRRPTVFPLPAFVAKAMFGEMAKELLLAGQRARALPARLLDAGFSFRYPELDAALEHSLAE